MSATTRDRPPTVIGRATRSLGRLSAPFIVPLAGRRFLPLWAVVHTRGRRSGRAYAIPVAIRASPHGFTIPLPWGDQTQWLRNVLAADGCLLRWRGSDHPATDPRVVDLDDAADAFHPIQLAVMRAGGVRSVLRLSRDVSAD